MSWEVVGDNKVRFREKNGNYDMAMVVLIKRGDLGKKYLHKAELTIWDNEKEVVGSTIYNLKMFPHNIDVCTFRDYTDDDGEWYRTSLKRLKKYLKSTFDIDLKEYEKKSIDALNGWCG